MRRLRKPRSPGSFPSALAGGLVALAAGWAAVSAGWIDVDDDPAAAATPGLALEPVAEESTEALSVNEIYRRSVEGVASIEVRTQDAAGSGGTNTGSGFVLDEDGHIVTNAHVVEDAAEITVTLGEDGEELEAEVVGADNSTDVAVLDVDVAEDELTALPLGDAETVDVGDGVVAIGSPFGLSRTVTDGIVSAVDRQIEAPDGFTITDAVQTDAAINPGNSGGPLLDETGRVIGINSQIESSSGSNVGIAFAVPVETVSQVASELIEDGSVEHAYLGVAGADVDAEVADALELDTQEGALVQSVTPGSPADDAGLSAGDTEVQSGGETLSDGDVIVAANDETISEMADLIGIVDRGSPGDELRLEVLRDGREREVTVTLGERPSGSQG